MKSREIVYTSKSSLSTCREDTKRYLYLHIFDHDMISNIQNVSEGSREYVIDLIKSSSYLVDVGNETTIIKVYKRNGAASSIDSNSVPLSEMRSYAHWGVFINEKSFVTRGERGFQNHFEVYQYNKVQNIWSKQLTINKHFGSADCAIKKNILIAGAWNTD